MLKVFFNMKSWYFVLLLVFVSCQSSDSDTDQGTSSPTGVSSSHIVAPPPEDYPNLVAAVFQCESETTKGNSNGMQVSSSVKGPVSFLRVYGKNKTLNRGDEVLVQTLSKRGHNWKALTTQGACPDGISFQCQARADSAKNINCISGDLSYYQNPSENSNGLRKAPAFDSDSNRATLSKGLIRIQDDGKGFFVSVEFTYKDHASPCLMDFEYNCAP